ncbi:NAD+ synthase [Fangia hongkongensis]|uniref:NAD+ synthase n=1 Tax=Fangia hongkongensis TaxID=270495 RepID=UPI00037DAF76|nr:NAD+ synthase [Fangia hongkongensis]MBK2125317.1 NAD+ synthase [Fangia hongkongensis]
MKITIGQCSFVVADFAYNYHKIKEVITNNQDSDLIVFSELCVIGYYPYDLLVYDEVIKAQNEIIEKIKQLSEQYAIAVIIGVASAVDGIKKFHNSALVIDKGEVVFTYHKKLIPSYSIFDEKRHFIAGEGTPFFELQGKRIALFICEDIWFDNHQGYLKNPVLELDHNKVDCVITLNASPSMLGKFAQRESIVKKIAQEVNAPVIYASQVGGYDEIIYDGASFVSDNHGNIVALANSFKEDVVSVDIDNLPQKVHSNPYSSDYALILDQLILGLQDYLRKCRFTGVVIGSSGGIDSALTLAIAALALGKENVKAITMPSVYSSEGSVSDSERLCHNLGIHLYHRPIKEEFEATILAFEKAFGKEPKKLTKENMQARIRGRIVMEYSNDSGLLMLTTGNKSELAVGYATLYGDMCGALNCIGDLYKHDVYALSEYINQIYGELIPREIIDKAPSAELSEGQKDSDSLPDYRHLDAMLKLYLERDLLMPEEVENLERIVSEVDSKEQRRIYRMVELNEFKRKQAPQILIIQRRPFGIGRRMPVTGAFQK